MINYLKGLGYKYTTKDTLNDKEFRLLSETVEVDEELTTLGNMVTNTIKIYELFLSTRKYSEGVVQGIVSGANENGDIVFEVSADVETQERGYLITLTFNKRG